MPGGGGIPFPGGGPGGGGIPDPGGGGTPDPGGKPGGGGIPDPGGKPGGGGMPDPGGKPGGDGMPKPGGGGGAGVPRCGEAAGSRAAPGTRTVVGSTNPGSEAPETDGHAEGAADGSRSVVGSSKSGSGALELDGLSEHAGAPSLASMPRAVGPDEGFSFESAIASTFAGPDRFGEASNTLSSFSACRSAITMPLILPPTRRLCVEKNTAVGCL